MFVPKAAEKRAALMRFESARGYPRARERGRAPRRAAGLVLSLKRGSTRPRNEAEARAWLKQFASNLRDMQVKPDEVPLNFDLATWFADAVDAYTLEKPTKRKRRAWSMDVRWGWSGRVGAAKGHAQWRPSQPQSMFTHLRRLGATLDEIADRLQKDVRTLQRIC